MIKKILGGVAIGSLGYCVGDLIGRTIHNALAYLIPLARFSQYSWFNSSQYIQQYQQWSLGLENLFAFVFGLTSASLFLASYVDLLYKTESLRLKRS